MNNYSGRSSLELRERSIPPGSSEEANPGNELEINVIFTDHRGTMVPRVVPYAFPLASPPVSIQFTEQWLLDFARQVAQHPIVISVQLYLCRDRRLCLLQALKPQSLVVVGGRVRWWPTKETKLTKMLQSAGHRVVFVVSSEER